jgi:hypothetical protein
LVKERFLSRVLVICVCSSDLWSLTIVIQLHNHR